ncbi:integrase [Leifsonia sp. EB41]|uniref:tyrosine-type recombinase/integrase n=1 Tax=Leifsonia sp. EB41 TaxID=3156260 RepID=UPI003511CEFA
MYTILRGILDSAVRDELLGKNPAAALRRPKVEHHEAAYLNPNEVRHLLDAATGSPARPVFELLLHTGLRRGEALALRWEDIDFTARTIRVRGTLARVGSELLVTEPKTEKSRRTVYMTDASERVLRAARLEQSEGRLRLGSAWVQTGFVFTTEVGTPRDPRNLLRSLKLAAKKAGLPTTVGLHTLRHSAASTMLAGGVPLKVVSEILGHSSVAITGDIYGHVSPEVSATAMDYLSTAFA